MKPTIIFDLDGTLADTGPDLLAALNYSTALFNLKPLQRSHLGVLVGHGSIAMIERAFHIQNRTLPEEIKTECQTRFLNFYANNIANETILFDGALDCLNKLKTSGCGLAVCTNKLEDLAKQLIAELNLGDVFSIVSGGNSFAFHKPDGRHLLETVKRPQVIRKQQSWLATQLPTLPRQKMPVFV